MSVSRYQRFVQHIRGPLQPGRHWRHTIAEILESLVQPPTSPRQNRLSRRVTHEVTIYLSEDNMIFVHHLSLTGKGKAEVGIRMCWEAMQHLAMQSGLALNLPTQAAVPVQIQSLPDTEPVPAQTENGSH